MLKSGSNYRMSAQAKRFASTILDPHQRGAYKRAMIDAELSAAQQYKPTKNKKDSVGG
jgi:hypothetical protein